MKKITSILPILLIMLFSNTIISQEKNELFYQNFFRSGRISKINTYYFSGERSIGSGYANDNTNLISFRTLIPVSENIEFGCGIGYLFDIKSSGLMDLHLVAKYGFEFGKSFLTLGTYLILPTGSGNVHQSNSVNGLFISFSNEISEKIGVNIALNGVLEYSRQFTDRDYRLFSISDNTDQISVGVSYLFDEKMAFIFEITNNDYPYSGLDRTLSSIGINYSIAERLKLRLAVGKDLKNYGDGFFTLGLGF